MLRKKPKPPDDELSARLRASLATQRPRPVKAALVGLVLLLAAGIGLAWWFYPRAEPPPPIVIAFDQIAVPGEAMTLRARLEPADAEAPPPRLDGLELFFETGQLGDIQALGQATTGADGEATLAWQPPPAVRPYEVTVRLPGDRRRKESSSQARVFVFPRDSAVLLIDVAALARADVEAWKTRHVTEIAAMPGVAAALKAARARGYLPVYLAQTVDSGRLYGQVRRWVNSQLGGKEPLLSGPVLGRGGVSADQSETLQLLHDLKQLFPGPVVGVTTDAQTARQLQIGGVPRVLHLRSWADLEKQLPKATK